MLIQTEIKLKYTVYGIYDDDGRLKYIGCTKIKLSTRLCNLLSGSTYGGRMDSYAKFFIQYINKGKRPIIKALKSFSNPKEAGEFEYKLIIETPNLINRSKRKQKPLLIINRARFSRMKRYSNYLWIFSYRQLFQISFIREMLKK